MYYFVILLLCLGAVKCGWGVELPYEVLEEALFGRSFLIQILSDVCFQASDESSSAKRAWVEWFINVQVQMKEDKSTMFFDLVDDAGMPAVCYLAMTNVKNEEDYENIKEICNRFIENGANINQKNQFGISPFRLASLVGNYAFVEAALNSGKLIKDVEAIKSMFSSVSDIVDLLDFFNVAYGRTRILSCLKQDWFPDISGDQSFAINAAILSVQYWCKRQNVAYVDVQVYDMAFKGIESAFKLIADELGKIFEARENEAKQRIDIWKSLSKQCQVPLIDS